MAVRSARGLKLNDRVAEDVVVPPNSAQVWRRTISARRVGRRQSFGRAGTSRLRSLSTLPAIFPGPTGYPGAASISAENSIRSRRISWASLSDVRQRLFQRLDRRKPNGERSRPVSRVVRSRALFSPCSLRAARGRLDDAGLRYQSFRRAAAFRSWISSLDCSDA